MAGVSDERLGEIPVAAVIPTPGSNTTTDAITLAVGARLARYEIPRRILLVQTLPRTDIGKIDRPAVARLFGADST